MLVYTKFYRTYLSLSQYITSDNSLNTTKLHVVWQNNRVVFRLLPKLCVDVLNDTAECCASKKTTLSSSASVVISIFPQCVIHCHLLTSCNCFYPGVGVLLLSDLSISLTALCLSLSHVSQHVFYKFHSFFRFYLM